MNRFTLSVRLLFLTACVVLLGCSIPAEVPAQDAVAFVNVNVLPMTSETVLEGQTVVVRDGRIIAVGADVEVPAGATQVDGTGKFLMPGLAEMHGHIPPPNAPQAYIEHVLFLYLSQGITTVRGMLGQPGQLDLRERALAGDLDSPTLYLAGPSFNGNSVSSPEQAAEMVRAQHAEGWDLLKIHPGLTRPEYNAMAETAREVGITFAGHVPAEVGLLHALEQKQLTIDHVDGYNEYLNGFEGPIDEAQLAEVVRLTREAETWIVPTMAVWETLYGVNDIEMLSAYPELQYMPPQIVAQWKAADTQRRNNPNFNLDASQRAINNRVVILAALHEGGVPILMGTDAPQQFSVPGFSLHRELKIMEQAGMTPYEILHSGTVNVGRYFADKDTFGSVAEGHRADLVLLDANPLTNLNNTTQIAGVMARGRWWSRADIDARLADIAQTYATAD